MQGADDPSSEKFEPCTFLLKVYPNSSWSELEQGLRTLKAAVENRTEKLQLLVSKRLTGMPGG